MAKATPVIRTLSVDQKDESEDGGHEAADEFDEAGADEIADAFDVAHDARDERAGFVGVVIGRRAGGRCALAPSGAARRSGAGAALERSWVRVKEVRPWMMVAAENAEDDGSKQIDLVLDGDVVDEIFCGGGKDEAADAVDGHQTEAEDEQAAARLNQSPNVGQGFPGILFLLRLRGCDGIGFRWHSWGPNRMSFLDAHSSS